MDTYWLEVIHAVKHLAIVAAIQATVVTVVLWVAALT